MAILTFIPRWRKSIRNFTAFLLALSIAALSTPAMAQPLCGKRADFLKHLSKNHQEAPTAMGLTGTGKIVEVLTSEDGGWTIIITDVDGDSCLVAAGENWEVIERVATEPAT